MRTYINTIIAALVALAAGSCSEDVMDKINENKNYPGNVNSEFTITDIMTRTAFSVTGTDYTFYSSVYVEHNVGIYNQMYNAEIRTSEPISSSTYNNSWDSSYEALLNLKDVIGKCSEGGTEEGNYHMLGIAQILTAYNIAILTDLFGDVPWTEALQPGEIMQPVLDKQEDIYADIFELLKDAITNLSKETVYASPGKQDLLYGSYSNYAALWTKFANGLLARYTMRLSKRSPDYDAVIAYAGRSFTGSGEQCRFNYNGSSSYSPFFQFFQDRDYFGASQSFHDKLTVRNDPRDALFFVAHPKASALEYAPNGTTSQKQSFYGVSGISGIINDVATYPTYLMSYHELEFLKAEAYARKNDLPNAKAALKNAITAAFAKVNIGLSATDADNYYTGSVEPRLTSQATALQEIMIQKYIGLFEEEAMEVYNDVRRLRAMGEENFIQLNNPLNTNRFPLRFTYGSSDVTTNKNVESAYGDGSYVYTENVWWAGGTR